MQNKRNDKKYEIKAIYNGEVYTNKLDSNYFLNIYYLIL